MDTFITESYFNWLKSDAFVLTSEQRNFEGVLRVLHEVPFTWIIHSDDNRSGDAVTFRQYEFLDQIVLHGDVNPLWLGQWATSAPSVLEVLLACARRWNYYFDGPCVAFYFQHMFRNMGFHDYPGRHLDPAQQQFIRQRIDMWLTRQFHPDGVGSPWPLRGDWRHYDDQRRADIWQQMNAYSAEHFQ